MTSLFECESPIAQSLPVEGASSQSKASPESDTVAGCTRLGRSPFWLHVEPESFGVLRSSAYRTTITYKPTRKRNATGVPLIDISPRHPIFTLKIDGESFPLVATDCILANRGCDVELKGTRKAYLSELHTVDFSIRLKPVASKTGAEISAQFKCKISPPLPRKAVADLKVEIYSPMLRPEPWWFPYSPPSQAGSILLWNSIEGVSVSCVMSGVEGGDNGVQHIQNSSGHESGLTISQSIKNVIKPSSGSYEFSIRLDQARIRSHAQFMHMRHTQKHLNPELPTKFSASLPSLRARAMSALARITDKSTYHNAGIERVYYRRDDSDNGPEFCAGFPHFPLDAARAMLDWDRLMGNEESARLAILIARGIGTDFAVISADAYGKCANKGALWDRRRGINGDANAVFTDFLGDDFHSIASTARIAAGLFRVYQLTGDPISLNAGINASQWLLLRQNSNGYYDGDRVDASTGAIVHESRTSVGIEVIHALVHAYYCTGNEIYIKAAHRVAGQIMSEHVPELAANPIYRTSHLKSEDTPATVASLIRALAMTQALLRTRRSAEELDQAGVWLRSWDLSNPAELPAVNNDGHYDGLYEIARAALAIGVTVKDSSWLQIALSIGASMPKEAWDGWQAIPLFSETMLGLIGLLKGSAVDNASIQAKAGWSDFAPDASTYKYLNVNSLPEEGVEEIPVDFLPLVSRADGRVLVPVLAHGNVKRVQVIQNGKLPNLKDLVTGEIVCQPAVLHKLPFQGPWRWGCFTIDP